MKTVKEVQDMVLRLNAAVGVADWKNALIEAHRVYNELLLHTTEEEN